MDAFADSFKGVRRLLVGGNGIPLEEFLAEPVEALGEGLTPFACPRASGP
jgi:hypothetical protein